MGQLDKLTVLCVFSQGWTQNIEVEDKYMQKLGNKAQMFHNHGFFQAC
jgi:hypothetical protein